MNAMTAVVISYNVRALLADCLTSLHDKAGIAEVIVVDNASNDGSAAMVRATFPHVRLIISDQNNGFGAAANQALRACRTPYVLLLNADTRLQADSALQLIRALDADDHAGVAGPQLIGANGKPQSSRFPFPTPLHVLLDLLGNDPARQSSPLGWRTPPCETIDAPVPTDWILGAALALRREAIEAVAGFDEGFLMFYEETDLCYRLRAAGWRTIFIPTATIEHVGGASTGQQRRRWDIELFRSRFRFYQQHYSPGQIIALRVVIGVGMIAKLARDLGRRTFARDAATEERVREDIRIWSRALGMAVRGDAAREQRAPMAKRR